MHYLLYTCSLHDLCFIFIHLFYPSIFISICCIYPSFTCLLSHLMASCRFLNCMLPELFVIFKGKHFKFAGNWTVLGVLINLIVNSVVFAQEFRIHCDPDQDKMPKKINKCDVLKASLQKF